jgi:PadR family transcriptional regulator, regulatory protein AphA
LSSRKLTPFSYVVLTLVGRSGAGPHDLVRMARQGRVYAEFAESQWYAEPKRLATLGLLEARTEPGRTGPRTHYTLTDRGIEALREWMAEPSGFSKIFMEPAIRLLAADLVGDEAVLESLAAIHEQIADLRARLDVAEEVAQTIPSRERYLLLNHALARRIVDAHEDWLREVEETLQSKRATSRGGRQARGRA